MHLNEMLNVLDKCAANLRNVLDELDSYNCDVDIDNRGKVMVCFALNPKNFIEYVKKHNLDFNSEKHGNKGYCKLFLCFGNVEIFTLTYFQDAEDEHTRKIFKDEFKVIEDFLKLD